MNSNLTLSDERFTRSRDGFSAVDLLQRIQSPRLADMPKLGPWIDQAADAARVSRELMCCVAQKEQSALTQKTLSDWALTAFCGYGVNAPGVMPRPDWQGPRNQLTGAAAGLRFLFDHAHETRTEWHATVGQYFAKARVTPQNRATAALYSYTPTVDDKLTLLSAWGLFGFGDPLDTFAARADRPLGERIAEIARQAADAHYAGRAEITINGHEFDLDERGYCARFMRQCHEAALGLEPFGWQFASPTSAIMEFHLRSQGKAVPKPAIGDIVCFNDNVPESRRNDYQWQKDNRRYGHIGVYVGNGEFAENTSSSRGPGTVVSKYAPMRGRVTGVYRHEHVAAARHLGIVCPDGSGLIDCQPFWKDGRVAAFVRPVIEGLGYECGWHEYDDGRQRVYPKRRGVVETVKSVLGIGTDRDAA